MTAEFCGKKEIAIEKKHVGVDIKKPKAMVPWLIDLKAKGIAVPFC